jgi:hypothetical protein
MSSDLDFYDFWRSDLHMKLKLLPSENFIIKTQDSIDIVRQKLMAQVQESTSIQGVENYFFKGQVFESEFKITRNSNYSNLSMPTIMGRLDDVSEGTVINVKMKVNFLMYLLCMFSFVNGLVELGVLSASIYSQTLVISFESLKPLFIMMINFFGVITFLTEDWKQFKIDREKLNQILVDEL